MAAVALGMSIQEIHPENVRHVGNWWARQGARRGQDLSAWAQFKYISLNCGVGKTSVRGQDLSAWARLTAVTSIYLE